MQDNEIRPITVALSRIYNNLEILCKFPDCKRYIKISDIESHEKSCNKPKCLNYEMCKDPVKDVLKYKSGFKGL